MMMMHRFIYVSPTGGKTTFLKDKTQPAGDMHRWWTVDGLYFTDTDVIGLDLLNWTLPALNSDDRHPQWQLFEMYQGPEYVSALRWFVSKWKDNFLALTNLPSLARFGFARSADDILYHLKLRGDKGPFRWLDSYKPPPYARLLGRDEFFTIDLLNKELRDEGEKE